MREIVSPLNGFLSPFGRISGSGGGGADAYAIGGASPELVAAFLTQADGTTEGEYFRTGGVEDDFSMFTFSRASSAWYFNSSGVLTEATSGTARRNAYYHNGTAWTKGGLQLESAAATNLLEYSSAFENAYYTKIAGVTVTAGTHDGPEGPSTADTITASIGGRVIRRDNIPVISGAPYTASYYIKKTTSASSFPLIQLDGVGVILNTDTGVLTTQAGSPVNPNVEDSGDYWGISFAIASASGAAITWLIYPAGSTDGTTYTSTTGSIVLGGSMLEAGSIRSSHIPTAGSTVTRAAETLSIAGADTPANTTAMSISIKGLMTYADEGASAQETFLRWQADANNFISLDLDTDSTATGEVNANQSAAGTLDTVVAGAEYSPGVNVAFNIASRHTSGAINVAKDGTSATADTTPTALADLSSTAVTLGYDFSGFISEIRMWGADIGDSGIEEVTS